MFTFSHAETSVTIHFDKDSLEKIIDTKSPFVTGYNEDQGNKDNSNLLETYINKWKNKEEIVANSSVMHKDIFKKKSLQNMLSKPDSKNKNNKNMHSSDFNKDKDKDKDKLEKKKLKEEHLIKGTFIYEQEKTETKKIEKDDFIFENVDKLSKTVNKYISIFWDIRRLAFAVKKENTRGQGGEKNDRTRKVLKIHNFYSQQPSKNPLYYLLDNWIDNSITYWTYYDLLNKNITVYSKESSANEPQDLRTIEIEALFPNQKTFELSILKKKSVRKLIMDHLNLKTEAKSINEVKKDSDSLPTVTETNKEKDSLKNQLKENEEFFETWDKNPHRFLVRRFYWTDYTDHRAGNSDAFIISVYYHTRQFSFFIN